MILEGVALSLALAASPAEVSRAGEARAELEACAERIEELKARRREGDAVGRELERLLVRAQELAAELDRAASELPPPPGAPSPEELRERADALRDEADRLASEVAHLDVKIGDLRRSLRSGGPTDPVALGSRLGAPRAEARLAELAAQRDELSRRREAAEGAAARLEAEAEAADAEH